MAKLLPSLTLRGLADYVGVAIGLIVAMNLTVVILLIL